MQTVRSLLKNRASTSLGEVFLISAETADDFTFQSLLDYARSVEQFLDNNQVEPGSVVAFMLDNGIGTSALMLAIMYAGRVVLPINVVSGASQIDYVMTHSQPKMLFCSKHYKQNRSVSLEKLDTDIRIIEYDEQTGSPEIINEIKQSSEKKDSSALLLDESQTALLIYTSGTTGRPKGVMLSHRNVIAGGNNTMSAHALTARDRTLCILPLYHINAQMVSIMAPLVSGGSVVVSNKMSISKLWDWILDNNCSWFSAVPTVFSYLVERYETSPELMPDIKKLASNLRFARSASAPLSTAALNQFESMFNVSIVETMGISECAAQILSNPINPHQRKVGSAGVAVGNEVKIVDSNHQQVEANIQGEIAVRGDNVMQGYLKDAEATVESLDNNGWFYTGDLGHMDIDGFVYVTGRLKELIIKGGENIAPREIDEILYKHPDILEAAAFAVPDTHYGQQVMAAVTLKTNAKNTEPELLAYCEERLGTIKTPKNIWFLEELPKGPSGKIQRLKLAEMLDISAD